jgi:hypothetical protein
MADQQHVPNASKRHCNDYAFDQHGALRHKKCGGQIAVEAELYVISGFGFPESLDEVEECRIERGPRGITITRKFGGYRGYCMKCHHEGNFYGPRYHARRQHRWSTQARPPCKR